MRLTVNGSGVFVGTGSAAWKSAGTPVLFLHGAGMDHTVWTMPARFFARHGCNVLAPDLPGHGRSEGDALDSVAALADWSVQLLDAAGQSPAFVVGHSMGTLVALQIAAEHMQCVRGLVLLGTAQPMPVTPLLLNAANDRHPAAYDMANTWSHSAAGRLGGNPVPGVWMMGAERALLGRNRGDAYARDLQVCNGFTGVDPERVNVPVLVVTGDADQMTPARAGKQLADALQGARVVTLPGCGHSMLSESPNAVLDAMAAFILG